MADYPYDSLANASPQLLDLLAEYGLISPQQQFAARQMAEAEKMRDTPMPEGMTVRNQYIAPSILGIADATMRRIMGGQDAEREKQAIMAGFLRKMQANRAMGQHEQDMTRAQMDAANTLHPENGAMMSPDPSTMTDENVLPGWVDPWDMKPTQPKKPSIISPPAPFAPDTSMNRGRSAGVTSPYFGFGDTQGVNRRK